VLRRSRLALPALATGVFAFNAGGFFPGTTALICVVFALGLVLRITVAERPWEGWSLGLALAAGAMALLAAWILASAEWSDAPGRAIVEFDRALLYALAVVVFGLFRSRAGDLSLLLRWLAGVLCLICIVALATRLLPGTFPTSRAIANDRLTFPLTYWNAMGILGALALVLSLHVSASAREPAYARVLAAAAAPAAAATLYFTFSRGGIAAAAIGLAIYVVLGHPRGLLSALVSIVPTVAYAVHTAYDAELLATVRFELPAAADQRSHVLVVVVICMALAGAIRAVALLADRRLASVSLPEHRRRAVWTAATVLGVLAVAATVVVADLPHRLNQERREFLEGGILPSSGDLRDRLTQTGNNGRLAHWRVARDEFEKSPGHGSGAGTFRLLWEQNRPRPPFRVNDAHSLYLETAAELGVPGLILLAIVLLAPLGVAATRLNGPERHAYAGFLAAGGALLAHAGVDWDWEMPALFLWFFAASGVVLGAVGGRAAWAPGRLPRLVAALACLLLAVTPGLVLASQAPLARSVHAFKQGDCRTAVDAALDSRDALGARPEPYEIIGYCDARAGQNTLAVRAMREAQQRDPRNWQYAYGLAATQALAGEDPRRAARLARRLNPLGELPRALERGLRSDSPQRRRRFAARAPVPFD
jgi:O-Antigen ligase